MRIAVDARYLCGRTSGIGRYSENLLRQITRIGERHTWRILVQPGYAPPEELTGRSGVQLINLKATPLSTGTLLNVGRELDALGCDLAHIHFPIIPLRMHTPLAVTFHDWQPWTVPDFSGDRPLPLKLAYDAFYRWMYPHAARQARVIFCDSEATRRDTLRFVPESRDRAHTVLPGLAPEVASGASAEGDEHWIARHGLGGDFVLYVGSTRPNKHLPTLVQAFAAMAAQHPQLRLVLALSTDRFWPALKAQIDSTGLTHRITVLERIAARQLCWLYRHARVLAQATAAEGFGFPVLEGLANGCPVIIGEDGSLPEIAGDCAVRVQPGNATDLADALARVLGDEPLARRLRECGPLRALAFDWERTAHETLELLEKAG